MLSRLRHVWYPIYFIRPSPGAWGWRFGDDSVIHATVGYSYLHGHRSRWLLCINGNTVVVTVFLIFGHLHFVELNTIGTIPITFFTNNNSIDGKMSIHFFFSPLSWDISLSHSTTSSIPVSYFTNKAELYISLPRPDIFMVFPCPKIFPCPTVQLT